MKILSKNVKHNQINDLEFRYKNLMIYIAMQILCDKVKAEKVVKESLLTIYDFYMHLDVNSEQMHSTIILITRKISMQHISEGASSDKASVNKSDFASRDIRQNDIAKGIDDRYLSIEAYILNMDNKHSDILAFKYYYQYTNVEISKILKIPAKAIQGLYQDGIKQLMEVINDENYQ